MKPRRIWASGMFVFVRIKNTIDGSENSGKVKQDLEKWLHLRQLQVEWHTGFNELQALSKKVRSADVLLVLTSQMSHKAYYIVKNQGKALNKQIVYYNGQSIKGAAIAVAA